MTPKFRVAVEKDNVSWYVICHAENKDKAADVAIEESGADSVLEVEDWGE